MAKNRMINTKFWSDGWIVNLNPLDKYLFLYFLTNEHTNICGIYELPIRIIARESGINDEMVKKMLKKMGDKIAYIDGWVGIKNFLKHQKSSGNVKIGIENGLNEVPKEIMAKISKVWNTPPTQGGHSPILELESELESELELKDATPQGVADIPEIINLFKTINPSYKKWFANITQRGAVERMLKEHGREKIENLIKALPETNVIKYMPVITTPLQLEDKMAALIFNLKKESGKGIQSI